MKDRERTDWMDGIKTVAGYVLAVCAVFGLIYLSKVI